MSGEATALLRRGLEHYHEHKRTRTFLDEVSRVPDVAHAIPAEVAAAYDARNLLWVELLILAAHEHPSLALVPIAFRILGDRNGSLNNEDVVELLERLRAEAAVPCLAETLNWTPDWDEYRNLGVKCIWALAAIGTEEARHVIASQLQSAFPKLREAAVAALPRKAAQ